MARFPLTPELLELIAERFKALAEPARRPEQRLSSSAATTRHLREAGDLLPADLLIQSVFRPPRLS